MIVLLGCSPRILLGLSITYFRDNDDTSTYTKGSLYKNHSIPLIFYLPIDIYSRLGLDK